jgi:thermitase
LDYKGKSLNDPKISSLWAFNFMDIDKLQMLLKGAKPLKKAKIFILDTGVDAGHEDLAGNYISLTKEYDTDTDRHGTHCAGIANAVSNNMLGIASLNLTGKLVSITSITVLPGGSGRQENIIDGIILAADNEADVISMSLGGASTDKRQKAYEKAIKYANDKGAIIVVAAGNENINAKLAVPASCKGVITVSAIDDKLEKAIFSNYVSDIEYKLSAPGVGILSTTPHNDYQFLSGTSMATPYVAGLIGIMKAFEPKLTTEDVYRILNSAGKETQNTQMTGKLIQPLPAISSIDTKTTQSTIKEYVNKFFAFKPDKN